MALLQQRLHNISPFSDTSHWDFAIFPRIHFLKENALNAPSLLFVWLEGYDDEKIPELYLIRKLTIFLENSGVFVSYVSCQKINCHFLCGTAFFFS